jgi:hypothetical protein
MHVSLIISYLNYFVAKILYLFEEKMITWLCCMHTLNPKFPIMHQGVLSIHCMMVQTLLSACSISKLLEIRSFAWIINVSWALTRNNVQGNRAVKLWHISGSKRTKRSLKHSHNLFLQLILYQRQSDIWTENLAMKKEVGKISMLMLFNLDLEVIFHTNDVTLNSSIVIWSEMGQNWDKLRKVYWSWDRVENCLIFGICFGWLDHFTNMGP